MSGSERKKAYPPHRKLPLQEKIEIIKEYERTKQRTHLARMFHCHVGQVNRTLQHKMELVAEFRRIASVDGETRKKRGACKVLKAVGTVLHEFIQRCQFYPIQLNDEFLLDKAREIAKIFNLASFKGHYYWLKTFKLRFKLQDIDWSTWSQPYSDTLLPLDLATIVEELRAQKGEHLIPYPSKMDQSEYEKAVQELILNSDPYPGYMNDARSYNDNYEHSDFTHISLSDDDVDMNHFDENALLDFDPIDLLSIEDGSGDVGKNDDPMNIDCYRTALSYFRPFEQFILSKKDDRVVTLINQLGNVLLRSAEAEEEQEYKFTADGDDQCTPSIVNEVQIEGYQDAVKYLQPLEEFVLEHENMRAVGLINQLEILVNDKE